MLKIRLQRIGKKNSPSFRVVLVEHTTRPQGKFLELLGSYNKIQKQKNFNKERILYWISKGVQASPTMHNLLVDEKIIDKAKVKAWKPKRKTEEVKKEGVVPPTPAEGVVGAPYPSDKSEGVGVDTEPKKE
ncbi:MAG TPA: 30S ribosomal protein S16 [Candidatus Paceibacterota bacterium]|nr:30S ribosomal protein S16 [Candidatus Paceibacterota bacterium]